MRHSWPDLPGIAVWAWPRGRELSIRIEPPTEPRAAARAKGSSDAAIEAEWARQCAANPRLFDGAVLSVSAMRIGEEIRARRESYKRLTVQPTVECGVDQLSVTGVVMRRDAAGRDRVFLGRRGVQTRIYGGQWELGPSGGIDPVPGRDTLCEQDLIDQLQREFNEETGFTAALAGLHVHAVCQDLVARSYDIVFVCRVDGPLGKPADAERWEYDLYRWAPVAKVREMPDVIPPTRALFRFFGWA